MWLIAGLGNPGNKYSRTRHNVGFRVIDRLSEQYGITLQEKDSYSIGKGAIGGCRVILLKPLTFMNRSGIAVQALLRKAPVMLDTFADRLIVVHDDLDIETGVIRVRRNGSSGGHKGVESIITELGTREFIRIKIGIGRDAAVPVEGFVLSPFSPEERTVVKDAIIRASCAAVLIVTEGLQKAMTLYNRSAGTKAQPQK